MPTERLSIRTRRAILRLKWLIDRSYREIARVVSVGVGVGVGVGSPTQVVARANRAKITCWADVEALSDDELAARMYPPPDLNGDVHPAPNPAVIVMVKTASRPALHTAMPEPPAAARAWSILSQATSPLRMPATAIAAHCDNATLAAEERRRKLEAHTTSVYVGSSLGGGYVRSSEL